ncbi:MAG: XylR family transcriptional regulator, partial [Planctomycetota bacterium]
PLRTQEYRVAVLLPMDIGYGRGVMQGVGQHVSQVNRDDACSNWRIYRSEPSVSVLPLMKKWKPDGVIAHIASQELARPLSRIKQPVVNTTSTVPDWHGPLVEVDHDEIGRMAADHFLSRGFRSFGYVGSEWAGFSIAREAAFRSGIEASGYRVSTCHLDYLPSPPTDQAWNHVDAQLVRWIKQLELPCAVLASNDRPARELADACQSLRLDVPDEIAILGVDDDEYECFLGEPPISSIVNPSEAIGHAACQLLTELMDGGEPPKMSQVLTPPRVIVRQSSDSYAVQDPYLREALEMIRRDAVNGVTPAMIHDRLECSRRLLERRFRTLLGHSMLEEIRRVQLRHAHQLLLETRLPIERIADLVGFTHPRTFSTLFRKRFGSSPTDIRRRGDAEA